MSAPILYIGNKNYSSWSMRPWLALRWAGIAFEERVIPLDGPGYGAQKIAGVLAVSPSGRVPVLHADGAVIHDSLAICEWANERAPQAHLWPADRNVRAEARSAAAEMHSGFAALRRDLSMNLRRRLEHSPDFPDDTRADLERLFELWSGLLARFHGAFLFGERTIVDAMFAPVATRLRTYAVSCPPDVQAYCAVIFNDAAFQDWERAALSETWTIAKAEALYR
ncbi:MAG TPA: glutathione S-transferase family protein [Caulobacterales bacterium]|nr:glutathione S-transferase family protein [Caulobacterales bacterium]